jgi:hypothetical protein
MVAGCPRPLSRKKLSSMMWRNRTNLTAVALAHQFSRKPGKGRFRNRLEALRDHLEKEQRKAGVEGFAGAAMAKLAWLKGLFTRSAPTGVRVARAARAK